MNDGHDHATTAIRYKNTIMLLRQPRTIRSVMHKGGYNQVWVTSDSQVYVYDVSLSRKGGNGWDESTFGFSISCYNGAAFRLVFLLSLNSCHDAHLRCNEVAGIRPKMVSEYRHLARILI